MANDYYTVEREPKFLQRAGPQLIAKELQAIEDGFDGLPTKNQIAGHVHVLSTDTADSVANAYVLTSVYPLTKLEIGVSTRFFAAHTNTGPSTADVDGTGVNAIVNIDGTALAGGEIVSGWPVEIIHNGTHWRLMNSAKRLTAGIVLASALSPQNYQRDVAIGDLILPAASGGVAPYTYAVTGLPAGLAFEPSTRVQSGTPTTIGSSTVTYTVTDANALEFTFQFQIRVVASLIMLPDPQDRTLTVGNEYTFTLAVATGGTSPFAYGVGGLPTGMVFDPETREVSGVPTESGVFPVTLSVSDAGDPQQTASQNFDLTVRSADALSLADSDDRSFVPNLAITPFTLPAASGGVQPYTYIVTGLGEGLVFDPETREVSGTPTGIGDRIVTYRAEDSQESQVEQQFTLAIETAGRRYMSISPDRSISTIDIQAGNSYSADHQELTIPTWSGGTRYLVVSQPDENDDLTNISLAGFGNSLNDFEKQSYTREVDGVEYAVWISIDDVGDVIAGEIIEVRP